MKIKIAVYSEIEPPFVLQFNTDQDKLLDRILKVARMIISSEFVISDIIVRGIPNKPVFTFQENNFTEDNIIRRFEENLK